MEDQIQQIILAVMAIFISTPQPRIFLDQKAMEVGRKAFHLLDPRAQILR
jgi:hypothetical protein